MDDKIQVKIELLEQLEKVRQQMVLLDWIEEKLVEMKLLAQRILDEALTQEEIQSINKQVNQLEVQVKILNKQYNERSKELC